MRNILSTAKMLQPAYSVKLDTGLREGISPGQACVFYDIENSSRVLGGGWIYDNRLS